MIVFLCTAACVACGNFVLCFPDESRSVHFFTGNSSLPVCRAVVPFFFLSFIFCGYFAPVYTLSLSVFYVPLCNFTTQGQVVRQAFVPNQLSLDNKFWSVQSVSLCDSLCHSLPLSLCFSLSLFISLSLSLSLLFCILSWFFLLHLLFSSLSLSSLLNYYFSASFSTVTEFVTLA